MTLLLLLIISSLLHVILLTTTTTLLEKSRRKIGRKKENMKARSRQVPGSFYQKSKFHNCDSLLGLADIVTRQHPCRDNGCNHAREKRKKAKKLSEIWCDMHVFVLYGSVDAALGKVGK